MHSLTVCRVWADGLISASVGVQVESRLRLRQSARKVCCVFLLGTCEGWPFVVLSADEGPSRAPGGVHCRPVASGRLRTGLSTAARVSSRWRRVRLSRRSPRICGPRAGSVAALAVQRRIGQACSCVSGRSSAACGPGMSSWGRRPKGCGFISSAFLSLACRQSCRRCRVCRGSVAFAWSVRHAHERMPDCGGGLWSIACARGGKESRGSIRSLRPDMRPERFDASGLGFIPAHAGGRPTVERPLVSVDTHEF